MFLLPCLQSSLLVNRLAKGGHPTWYRLWKRSLCLRQAGKKLWDWIWLNCLLETPSSPVSDVHCTKTSLTKPRCFGFCLEFPRTLLSKNSGRLDWTTPRATSTFGMKHFTQMTSPWYTASLSCIASFSGARYLPVLYPTPSKRTISNPPNKLPRGPEQSLVQNTESTAKIYEISISTYHFQQTWTSWTS